MERTTFEQAVEIVSSLPDTDRERFDQWFNEQERQDTRNGTVQGPSPISVRDEPETQFQRSLRWLAENKTRYQGQWVALDGDRLLAAGLNGKQVYEEARAAGVSAPLLHQINPEDDLPFGGW